MEYEAARSCHLITAGDLFGRSGYGVGLQKGSPWADKVTLAILDFHESKSSHFVKRISAKLKSSFVCNLASITYSILPIVFLRWYDGGS